MKKRLLLLFCFAVLLLEVTGCGILFEDEHYEDDGAFEMDCEEQLEAQLGLLCDYITEDEWEEALYLLKKIDYLKEERFLEGEYEISAEEETLLEELNWLYDDCTKCYLMDEDDYGYDDEDDEVPEEKVLATYKVKDNGSVGLVGNKSIDSKCPWTDKEIKSVWKEIRSILPEDCMDYFVKLVVFTDGQAETLAYVEQTDDYGAEWMLAIDPADYEDRDLFVETIVHEFFHCVTLNDEQVYYTDEPEEDAYSEEYEEGVYCIYPDGSYVMDFYDAFWTGYIDDREINMESEYFYYRHEDDFVTDYAASSPAEDICESFAYFVLYGDDGGNAVWEQKINFFYDYPELVEYRDEIRDNLDM